MLVDLFLVQRLELMGQTVLLDLLLHLVVAVVEVTVLPAHLVAQVVAVVLTKLLVDLQLKQVVLVILVMVVMVELRLEPHLPIIFQEVAVLVVLEQAQLTLLCHLCLVMAV